MADQNFKKKPKYESPIIVSLGDLAHGIGYCEPGSNADPGYCTAGNIAASACSAGGYALGAACSAGTHPGV